MSEHSSQDPAAAEYRPGKEYNQVADWAMDQDWHHDLTPAQRRYCERILDFTWDRLWGQDR